MKSVARLLAAAAIVLVSSGAHAATTLRIGLASDPNTLDPATDGSVYGRIIFAALCDKLVEVDRKMQFVPQLATEWSWSADRLALTMKLRPGVQFHDGEKFDAAAVKANIDRYKNMAESRRKSELAPVKSVTVIDPLTARFDLERPYAPLLSILSDRAGMMGSPKEIAAAGANFARRPICSGPFRFFERVDLDRIVLDRFDGYYDKNAAKVDRVVYLPITDNSVRLANLRAGQLDIIEQLAPTDLGVARGDSRIRVADSVSIAYNTFTFNVANGERANTPFGRDKRVREAFELAVDRNVINQVVFNGEYIPNNQVEAPGSPFHFADLPVPKRDVARAKQLLAEAGAPRPQITFFIGNNPIASQVGQVVQSMAGEAGFDVKLEALDGPTMVQRSQKGDYQAAFAIWSGRPDPDGNVTFWFHCKGFINWGKYCNDKLDGLLERAQQVTDLAERKALYRQAAEIYLADRPHMILYHLKWFWGVSRKVDGFQPHPDGLIRVTGVSVQG
ncbi:MAG: ABC transporter substrate-binding protein [Alphaproteobacteria bacterium]|nr:ABC transporter substrate-binding protein [Alphaproteobacteria bacterium]